MRDTVASLREEIRKLSYQNAALTCQMARYRDKWTRIRDSKARHLERKKAMATEVVKERVG